MIRNKYIILPFLFIAWAIIFVHSIIPHHHHSEVLADCNNCHETHSNELKPLQVAECDQDCYGNACHFHVDVLTKINLDNDFIVSFNYETICNIEISESGKIIYDQHFTKQTYAEKNFLRGPPHIV